MCTSCILMLYVKLYAVAHLEHGIEVIHLFTGRPLTKLYLEPGGLYGDVNGDGAIDRVQGYGRTEEEAQIHTGSPRYVVYNA